MSKDYGRLPETGVYLRGDESLDSEAVSPLMRL